MTLQCIDISLTQASKSTLYMCKLKAVLSQSGASLLAVAVQYVIIRLSS